LSPSRLLAEDDVILSLPPVVAVGGVFLVLTATVLAAVGDGDARGGASDNVRGITRLSKARQHRVKNCLSSVYKYCTPIQCRRVVLKWQLSPNCIVVFLRSFEL
jgi:hypothetical protein